MFIAVLLDAAGRRTIKGATWVQQYHIYIEFFRAHGAGPVVVSLLWLPAIGLAMRDG